MTALVKGANATLRRTDGTTCGALLVGITWQNHSAEVDVCALICAADGAVLSDGHFLFWNSPASPTGNAMVRSAPLGGSSSVVDRAQLVIDLSRLEPDVERVLLSISTLVPGQSLAAAGAVGIRAVDLEAEDGEELYTYVNAAGYTTEQCAVAAELYQRRGEWKLRIVDQGYAEGLAALAREHSVNVE
ncbi:TerD family protein [Calidifontibacter indicus]|uniref:Tellurium resistance protein TerD n=1 Tax=Calidifontibacter indicus TaxID=419650 RepID=A0A3D9UVS9_9MICO|nr:TerD family protein [Calidifontibacter indicus]REF32060.1 tellurium resistance protein TerD [Calidifontibacter indicus]